MEYDLQRYVIEIMNKDEFIFGRTQIFLKGRILKSYIQDGSSNLEAV
jgi:hypothetical protein